MHGIYYITEPTLAAFLVLASTAALYMGAFKAHKSTASLVKKAFSGIASGTVSALAWFFMYSHQHLGW
ncbi:hypothetical protein [Pseudodesulfovibrio tunisiensis]|uniref:hypothetical protein n=1 Tax=Pseudodesulfovibrio tunisiensis TaxID=463192 RepID=UPI001FB1A4A5|nr:hypothetical protein [Pseudodesulfovibrio tunisiensis]